MAGNILVHRVWVERENPSCVGQPGRMDGVMSQSGGGQRTTSLGHKSGHGRWGWSIREGFSLTGCYNSSQVVASVTVSAACPSISPPPTRQVYILPLSLSASSCVISGKGLNLSESLFPHMWTILTLDNIWNLHHWALHHRFPSPFTLN